MNYKIKKNKVDSLKRVTKLINPWKSQRKVKKYIHQQQ